MSEPDTLPACPSCGAPVPEHFCPRCGERRLAEHELNLWAQLAQLLGGMFSLDGRFWRSFWLLLARPGFLAAEYCRGARVRHMRPVQLFLVANLIYFVLQPLTGFNTFRSTLELQIQRQIYSAHLRPVVEGRLAESGEALEHFAGRFDSTASNLARSLLILLVPAFALVLALLQRGSRRGFVEHLVLATHHVAFQLAYVCVPLLWLLGWLVARGFAPRDERQSGLLLLLAAALWWWLALKRFYAERSGPALGKAVLLTASTIPLVLAYRYALFWIAFFVV